MQSYLKASVSLITRIVQSTITDSLLWIYYSETMQYMQCQEGMYNIMYSYLLCILLVDAKLSSSSLRHLFH